MISVRAETERFGTDEAGREDGWQVVEEGFDRVRLRSHETVFTIGNGILGTRGSFEEGYPGDRPATLIHGVFDGHPLAFTELANAPDWTALDVVLAGERFSLDRGEILAFRRTLDLRTGLMVRQVRWRSSAGRTTELRFERFASLAEPHLLCQRVTITPQDYDGRIEVRASLDGRQDTDGLAHWAWLDQGTDVDRSWLALRTRDSSARLGLAMRLIGLAGRKPEAAAWDVSNQPTLVRSWLGEAQQPAGVEKLVALSTSLHADDPVRDARSRLDSLGRDSWEELFAAQVAAWRAEWAISDIVIEGDPEAQLEVRFSIYQLLIAAPRESERVSIGAKTLSGFGYRGHVFWDTEIFMLPFFTHVRPRVARNLLAYRWHQLPAARRKAAANGYVGAQYAWETAESGDEVTPTWVPDAADRTRLVRIWTGDIELHVSADIAFAVWQYWRVTGDDHFMLERGAEMFFETARFWTSRAEWNAEAERYEYRDVIGPDEYHDHVDNNAFTNYMVRWHLTRACEIARWLQGRNPDAADRLLGDGDAADATIGEWSRVAERIYLPFDEQTRLIEQFDGYFGLRDVDLPAYAGRTASMQAILGLEGVQETQVIKQPDVLMLAYLLPDVFDQRTLRSNYVYYTPRTDHTYGSSLGPGIQAILSCRVGDPAAAYEHLMRAARADLFDVRGNAGDGIHGASAGAIWQAIVFGFAGLRFTDAGWTVDPQFPPQWNRLTFRFFQRGRLQTVDITKPAVDAVPGGRGGAAGDGAVLERSIAVDRGPEPVAAESSTAEASTAESPTAEAPTGEAQPPVDHAGVLPRVALASLRVRGFIFDLDGVLTDTADMHYRAWQRLADEIGVPFDRRTNEALRGLSRRESLNRLLDGRAVSETEAQVWMERKNRYYVELIGEMGETNVLPGVMEFLAEARATGIRIAVASASKNARAVIDRLALASMVDVICDGYTVKRSKPAPDLFFAAADRLGLDPSSCVVFEDAAAGVEAAHAGGMRAVGIGPADRVGEAEMTLPNGFENVHVSDVLAALGGRPEDTEAA